MTLTELPKIVIDELDDDAQDQDDTQPITVGPPAAGAGIIGGGTPGTCKVCGNDARNSRAVYCDEHKPDKTKAQKARRAAKRSAPPPPAADRRPTPKTPAGKTKRITPKKRTTSTGAPGEREWQEFLGDVFGLATTALGMWLYNDLQADERDDAAQEMAMTDDEAQAFAAPFGRMLVGTQFNADHGRKLLENLDVIDAGIVLVTYAQRVSEAMTERKNRRGGANVIPMRGRTDHGERPHATNGTAPAAGGSGPDRPRFSPFGGAA